MKRLLTFVLTLAGIFCFLANALYQIKKAGTVPIPTHLNVDLYDYFLPYLTFARQSVLAGSLPLWTPYQALGAPFFAAIQSGLLYPVNWVIFIMDVPRAMLVIQFLNVTIGIVGTLVYLRYLKVDWPAVIPAAALFGYSVLGKTFHLSTGSTYCWLPFVIYLTHRLFDRPSFGACAALAGSLTLCFLGGNTQHFYYIAIVALIYYLFMMLCPPVRHDIKAGLFRSGLFALALLLTVGLASIQLFPTLELSLSSIRSLSEKLAGGDPFIQEFSVVGMLRSYLDRTENLYYFGSSLLLIPLALGSRKHRPAVICLSAALCYTILFVLSKQVAALAIFRKVPLADSFRWNVRMIDVGHFMIAALVAIGLSSLWERAPLRLWDPVMRRLDRFWTLVVVYSLVVACSVYLLAYKLSARSLLYPLILAFCILGVFSLLFCASKLTLQVKRLCVWALAALILLDIVPHRNIVATVPATSATGTTSLFDKQLSWTKEHEGYSRVLLIPHGFGFYNPNVGSMFQLYSINSYETFTLSRWHNYVRFMMGPKEFDQITRVSTFHGVIASPFTELFLRQARTIGLTSLRYFVTYESDMNEIISQNQYAWKSIHDGDDAGSEFYVYENKLALPRAYLVNSYITTHSEEESLQAIKWNILKLASSIVLEGGAPSFPPTTLPSNPGRARIDKYGLNEVELHVEAEDPALVVLTDSYYPGWTVSVDGVRKPIWRANSLFRAVEVAPGNHTVVFRYRPASLRWGIAVSVCSLFLILSFSLLGVLRKGAKS